MSWFSKLTGHDAKLRDRQIAEKSRFASMGGSPEDLYARAVGEERNGGGWQDAFKTTAGAMFNNALPQLREGLQMTREDGIRRGISTGDLGTSYEGDVTSAWGKNLSNALAGTAMQGYENSRNRYLDLITGQLDRDQAGANASKQKRAGMWGGIGALAGGGIGFLVGGPAGAAYGAQAGSAMGRGFGG